MLTSLPALSPRVHAQPRVAAPSSLVLLLVREERGHGDGARIVARGAASKILGHDVQAQVLSVEGALLVSVGGVS